MEKGVLYIISGEGFTPMIFIKVTAQIFPAKFDSATPNFSSITMSEYGKSENNRRRKTSVNATQVSAPFNSTQGLGYWK